MEFTKPFIQTNTDDPPLTTFAVMHKENEKNKEQNEKNKEQNEKNKEHENHLQILMHQISFMKEELELEEKKNLSDIKSLSIDAEQLTEFIKVYLVVELFSDTPNWKYNIGSECMYSNPGMSTYSKEYIPTYKRHLHIPQLSIKKMEQGGVKLGRLVKGYRNFEETASNGECNKKCNIKDKEALGMNWEHFKHLMRRIGEIY